MRALEVAIAAAREAGAILLDHLRAPIAVQEKRHRADLVTAADRASEAAIMRHVLRSFPDAAFLGEETGAHHGTSSERWIVDPLDGTTNFAHGYPLFCVSLAYERDAVVEAGVIYAPLMDELFTASRNGGACRNGEPIAVSSIASVAQAMLCTGFKPYDFERNARFFARASHHAQAVRRDGSAALDLAYTAMGRFDGFWEFDLAAWDVAAGALLVREAGGVVSGLDGSPFSLAGASILASNPALQPRIHELFAPLLND